MSERFVDALIGILEINVFAYHRHFQLLARMNYALNELAPLGHIRRRSIEVKEPADRLI